MDYLEYINWFIAILGIWYLVYRPITNLIIQIIDKIENIEEALKRIEERQRAENKEWVDKKLKSDKPVS